jgi:ATP-dependent DNA helicase RecG
MTIYGDLDVSLIDEMPPGRMAVETKVYPESARPRVYRIVEEEVKKGRQAFIVYPLVEESEKLDLKDATRMAEHLQKDVFPEFRIGLLHGRMKSDEKEAIMMEFKEGRIQILVATTVIEVGIDIPQASLMVIEHAERFGLSQLHQLRGRVGRSDIPSYCVLMSQYKRTEDSRKRLSVMEQTNDGFKIAEEDLAIRGPGEFMGTRQSGIPDFRIALGTWAAGFFQNAFDQTTRQTEISTHTQGLRHHLLHGEHFRVIVNHQHCILCWRRHPNRTRLSNRFGFGSLSGVTTLEGI